MGKNKTILILVGMTAAAALLYGAVSLRGDDRGKCLYQLRQQDSIETIVLENESGILEFRKNPAGGWLVKEDGEGALEYSAGEEKMKLLTDSLREMAITRYLEEDNPQYGLNENSRKAAFTTSMGEHHKFTVGNETMTRSHVYIRDEERGQIGITDLGAVAQLGGGADAFRSREIFRVDMDRIASIQYRTGNQEPLTLRKTGGEWQMDSPYRAPARKIEITELLAEMKDWNLCAFASSTVYSEEQMGLSERGSFLTLTDERGRSDTLEIGRPIDTLVPVRNGGRDDILLLYADEVNLELLDGDTLLFFAPLRASVDLVAKIRLEVDGRVLEFVLDSENNRFYCNGKPIDPEAFYSFYLSYMALAAVGGDETAPSDRAGRLASLETEYKDGRVMNLRLIQRDADTCHMIVNNRFSGFYTSNEKLITLISKCSRLGSY